VTVGGRLFQALVPAAEKDRSPSVDLRVAGTTNAEELEDLRRCRDSNCATCCNCSERERYAGAGGHPSAVGRAKDRENSPVKDQRFATVSRNQHNFRRK